MADSAMPLKMKRVCLIQEVVRIQRNTSRKLDEKVRRYFLSEFSMRMEASGYAAKFRLDVIKSGIAAYEKQVEREEAGICPLYRPKGYQQEERRMKKQRTKFAWCKPHDTVIFCPPTPQGILAKKLKDIAENVKQTSDIKIKVVERAGRIIRSILPGLQEENNCRREDCMIHNSGGKGNCNQEGVVYRGQCLMCSETEPSIRSEYIGESGRSGYSRGKQHLAPVRNPESHRNNAFAKHMTEEHEGERDIQFKMDVIHTYKKPMERQVREGIEIYRNDAEIIMNSKLDHFQPAIRRIIFVNELED